MRIASVPLWPRYYGQPVYRNLALLDGKYLHLLNGIAYPVNELASLEYLLFRYNVLAFTESIADVEKFPWLKECVFSDHIKVVCTKKGEAIGIQFSRKSSKRWLILLSAWSLENDLAELELLRELYTYMNVGTSTTPGSLGQSLMRKTWRDYNLSPHTALYGYAESFIRDTMVGGRVDTPGLYKKFPLVIELDRASSYLAEFMYQPTRTAIRFKGEPYANFWTYYAHCRVTIPSGRTLALGPFPVRHNKHVEYPTAAGTYSTYLWKEQVQDCRAAGLAVELLEGIGWKEYTTDNIPWCQEIYDKRTQAPRELEPFVKNAIVAAIGRHAMQAVYYSLVPESEAGPRELPYCGPGYPTRYFIHVFSDISSANMLHWNAYTLMQAARQLYHFAQPYAEQGRLLATNYDSVIVLPSDDRKEYNYPRHDDRNVPPGTWRYMELHNAEIVAARSVDSDEKKRRPGVKKGLARD